MGDLPPPLPRPLPGTRYRRDALTRPRCSRLGAARSGAAPGGAGTARPPPPPPVTPPPAPPTAPRLKGPLPAAQGGPAVPPLHPSTEPSPARTGSNAPGRGPPGGCCTPPSGHPSPTDPIACAAGGGSVCEGTPHPRRAPHVPGWHPTSSEGTPSPLSNPPPSPSPAEAPPCPKKVHQHFSRPIYRHVSGYLG